MTLYYVIGSAYNLVVASTEKDGRFYFIDNDHTNTITRLEAKKFLVNVVESFDTDDACGWQRDALNGWQRLDEDDIFALGDLIAEVIVADGNDKIDFDEYGVYSVLNDGSGFRIGGDIPTYFSSPKEVLEAIADDSEDSSSPPRYSVICFRCKTEEEAIKLEEECDDYNIDEYSEDYFTRAYEWFAHPTIL